jgi:Protein of unknown function (DUF3572)
MHRDEAEAVALAALGWLLADATRAGRFLAAAGLAPDKLRTRLADPAFLAGVLDFILGEDATVTGFCDSEGLGYLAPADARAALPGGSLPNWT